MLRACIVAAQRRDLPRHVHNRSRAYATEAPFPPILKPSTSGQPLFFSHPHLGTFTFRVAWELVLTKVAVKSHELTEGIPTQEYEQRRRNLMDRLPDESVVVCLGGMLKYMTKSSCIKLCSKFQCNANLWRTKIYCEWKLLTAPILHDLGRWPWAKL